MERRTFLRHGSLAMGSLVLGRGLTSMPARAMRRRRGGKPPILVVVFQRGAMDGLAAVQPMHDDDLKKLRPSLYLPPSGLVKLNRDFGMHPAFAPLAERFRKRELAIVHGVGLPIAERSHFDAQDYMESATPGRKGTPDGWLNRLLSHDFGTDGPFKALALSADLPRAFHGRHSVLAVEDLATLKRAEKTADAGLATLYAADPLMAKASEERNAAADALALLDQEVASNRRRRYPGGDLSRSLLQIARLIHADLGVEIALVSHGGWDTHRNQGGERGIFNRTAMDFAVALDAFQEDLGEHRKRVLVLTMTEFGRTVSQNGANGTDHGRGSCFFLMGAGVRGKRIHGDLPALREEHLEEGRDLPVTTDFRAVLAGVVRDHLGIDADPRLFPGWHGKPLRTIG